MKACAPLVLSLMVLTAACTGTTEPRARGPIVLGDPATIVTETDSQYLRDALPDFDPTPVQPAAAPAPAPSQPAVAAADTAPAAPAPAPAPVAPAASGPGLTVDFGTLTVFLPDLEVRNASRNVKGTSGASYSSENPTLTTKTMTVSGATVKRVQQRLAYNVTARQGGTTLLLSALGTQNGPWQDLKGSGGKYTLAPQSKPPVSTTPARIRSAVQRAAREQRLGRKDEQALLAAVRTARDASAAPLAVALRTATWRVEGTDAKGKRFTKEVRVDFPL